jgi:bile acid:Na+ symporter, BASS family
MSILLLIIPILMLLMFSLGLDLRPADFLRVVRRPWAAIIGCTAQIVGLPLSAFLVASLMNLPPVPAVGLMLLAACPGGPSSNAFTKLVRGDVALSVTLTAVASVITVITLPVVVNFAMVHWLTADTDLRLGLGPVLGQNTATILFPIGLGMLVRARNERRANALGRVLRKSTLPLLLFMVTVFTVQQRDVLAAGMTSVALAAVALVISAMILGALMGWIGRLKEAERRAVLMEVGMQNAAQAMAVATSPFLLAVAAYAVPAVVYAVVMNLVLLGYFAWLRYRDAALIVGCEQNR